MKISSVVALAALLVAATPAFAANAAKEISVAAAHAGLAAQAKSVEVVHQHLHHAVNCLVGPGGTGFDDEELNPCGGMGDGAIPDTTDPAKKKILEKALAQANQGLDTNDAYAAAKAASEARATLKSAM